MKIKFILLLIICFLIVGCFGKTVTSNEIQERDGLRYLVNDPKPFSGVVIDKYKNGSIARKFKVKKGKKEGEDIVYFSKTFFIFDGGPAIIRTFKNNILDGEVIEYNSLIFKDAIIAKKNYKNGVPDGEWISYSKNGKYIAKTGTFKNGLPDGEFNFNYSAGKINSKLNFSNGLLNGPITYFYSNGQPKITIDFVNGNMNGRIKLYSKNGILIYDIPVVNNIINSNNYGGFYNEQENIEFYVYDTHIEFSDRNDSYEHSKVEFINLLLLNNDKPFDEEKATEFWKASSLL